MQPLSLGRSHMDYRFHEQAKQTCSCPFLVPFLCNLICRTMSAHQCAGNFRENPNSSPILFIDEQDVAVIFFGASFTVRLCIVTVS